MINKRLITEIGFAKDKKIEISLGLEDNIVIIPFILKLEVEWINIKTSNKHIVWNKGFQPWLYFNINLENNNRTYSEI